MSRRIKTTCQKCLARDRAIWRKREAESRTPKPMPLHRYIILFEDGTTQAVAAARYRVAHDGTVIFEEGSTHQVTHYHDGIETIENYTPVMLVSPMAYRTIS